MKWTYAFNEHDPRRDRQRRRGWRSHVPPLAGGSRGKRSPRSAGRGGTILGVTRPFDRGKEFSYRSMRDGGRYAGGSVLG